MAGVSNMKMGKFIRNGSLALNVVLIGLLFFWNRSKSPDRFESAEEPAAGTASVVRANGKKPPPPPRRTPSAIHTEAVSREAGFAEIVDGRRLQAEVDALKGEGGGKAKKLVEEFFGESVFTQLFLTPVPHAL